MNTPRVITSCAILSWPREKYSNPIRFAGTWKTYSSKAMPQLTNTAIHHGWADKFLRCAYQANVMKTLDSIKSPTNDSGLEKLDRFNIFQSYWTAEMKKATDLKKSVAFNWVGPPGLKTGPKGLRSYESSRCPVFTKMVQPSLLKGLCRLIWGLLIHDPAG